MESSFDHALVDVWRQVLVDHAAAVELDGHRYAVQQTPARRLRQVDFLVQGNPVRGLEQNPHTNSRWARMARSGKKVMQFLVGGRYVAVVVNGKVKRYGR